MSEGHESITVEHYKDIIRFVGSYSRALRWKKLLRSLKPV